MSYSWNSASRCDPPKFNTKSGKMIKLRIVRQENIMTKNQSHSHMPEELWFMHQTQKLETEKLCKCITINVSLTFQTYLMQKFFGGSRDLYWPIGAFRRSMIL